MNAQTISIFESLQKDYTELISKAKVLSESSDPQQRALAYEITIFVANQTAKTKQFLAETYNSEPISEENGYGALAD